MTLPLSSSGHRSVFWLSAGLAVMCVMRFCAACCACLNFSARTRVSSSSGSSAVGLTTREALDAGAPFVRREFRALPFGRAEACDVELGSATVVEAGDSGTGEVVL